jgi:serine protease Do
MGTDTVSRLLIYPVLVLGLSVAPMAGASPAPMPGDSPSSAYLGVMVDNVSPEKAAALHLKTGGAAIAGVDQDGPGYRAGLKTGDIVTSFNGKAVDGPDQLASLIRSSTPGATAIMSILRDGQSKEVKVTLGDWKQMAGMPRPPTPPAGSMGFVPPAPPMPPRMYPDFEVPSFTQLSARHGVIVEPLSPQLCEFFGVPQNKGVLVRSVEKGSLGAAAGLKAGDVIVRVNNETIHDLADWRRALRTRSGKVTLAVIRDKKEQTVEMNLPANSSELKNENWDAFDQDLQASAEEKEDVDPEFGINTQEIKTLAQLNPEQLDEIERQAEAATEAAGPAMKKQAEEMKKQAEEMRKQVKELHKQAEQMRKDVEKMTPEMARAAREMADTMKPTAKELSDMARDMAQQWKDMQPEFQQQMQQLKKELEQQKREWQEIFKGGDSRLQM